MNMHVTTPTLPPPPTDTGEPPRKPEPPPKPATRIITLTDRAPIRIIEAEWPIVGSGQWGTGDDEGYCSWGIHIKVRKNPKATGPWASCYIIHAKYDYSPFDEEEGQLVRVGRLITVKESFKLWDFIGEMGDQLRERILCDKHRRYVQLATDICFASLKPSDILT